MITINNEKDSSGPSNFPNISAKYFATLVPQKVDSKLISEQCKYLVTLDEFIESNFENSDGTVSNRVSFFEEVKENLFYKWELFLEALE